jgi:hypothetical protein
MVSAHVQRDGDGRELLSYAIAHVQALTTPAGLQRRKNGLEESTTTPRLDASGSAMAVRRAESRHRGKGIRLFRYGVLTECENASSAISDSQLDAAFLCRFE